jgi:hypothetical protein
MAQAFFERHAPDDVRAESAGQEPRDAVWPNVIEAMAEVRIDHSCRGPKKLDLAWKARGCIPRAVGERARFRLTRRVSRVP